MLKFEDDDEYQQVLDLAREVAGRSGVPPEVADDIAQEAVLAFFVQDTKPDNWAAWTTAVTKNKTVDYFRSMKRVPQANEDHGKGVDPKVYRRSQFSVGPSGAVVARIALSGVLHRLNDRDRALLEAQASGMTNAEIAMKFALKNENTVAVTIHRIKKKLRDQFPELAADPGHPRLY